jgi:hypothetical protein
MTDLTQQWDPFNSRSWASLLGLVYVPLFNLRQPAPIGGDHAVLLDGDRASFAFSAVPDPDFLGNDKSLDWTWSAHVRHSAIADKGQGRIYLRRWDAPSIIRRFEAPRQEQGAIEFLQMLQSVEPLQVPDVIQHVLGAFRLIRDLKGCREGLWAVQILNGLLLAADGVRRNRIDRNEFEHASTIGEAMKVLEKRTPSQASLAEVDELPKAIREEDLGVLGQYFLTPDPRTGLNLYPELLFRHASCKVYQEAHLELERRPQQQLSFSGMASTAEPRGSLRRDIRFTPDNLARGLVQQALQALHPIPDHLVILDPACGSGIFLQDCMRELDIQSRTRTARIIGYDISEISAYMSRVCLKNAVSDLSHYCPVIDSSFYCNAVVINNL